MLMDSITMLDSAAATVNESGAGVNGGIYDIAGSTLSQPTDGAILMRFSVNRDFKLPAGLASSKAESTVAPTAAVSYTIKKNGSSIGSLDFALGANDATFTFSSEVSFTTGDLLTVEAPVTADSTHDGLAWTLAGTLL